MKFRTSFWLSVVIACSAIAAQAGTLTYSCDTSVDATQAGTCAYLNSTISGLYNNTFTNATANIYIEQGNTGLGGSVTALNYLPFSVYQSSLAVTDTADAVDTGALAALSSLDAAVYGNDNVIITNALAGALGFTATGGVTPGLTGCTLGNPNCYDGVIIVTTPANLSAESGGSQSLYYRQTGGTQPASAYDYYSIVEHETDEILGTSSCMSTQGSTLSDPCDTFFFPQPSGTPAAVDLYRYNSAGNLAANNAYIGLSGAPSGAYFSYNGGLTNGAAGAVYNTLSNGNDYSDFANSCTFVQDATGCTGASFDITTDGNAEINTLDAVGFNVTSVATPEPGTMLLLGGGLMLAGLRGRSRRS